MNGLYLIKPTSIVSTGTGNSSSISANGSVTFSSCETLSLNGVFSADYDNYMIVMRGELSADSEGLDFRLRASGTDNSTSNSYVDQVIEASSTTVSGSRNTRTFGRIGAISNAKSGFVFYFYGPYLAQPTAWRSVNAYALSGASIDDRAGTHNQSTAYDGLTLDANMSATGRTMSGLLCVYGMVK